MNLKRIRAWPARWRWWVWPARRRRSRSARLVAVMDFDYGRSTTGGVWGNYDIGKGMADQVVDAILEDGSFRVIERKKLDTVLAEQDFAQSDRADPSAAKLSKVGKVLGVATSSPGRSRSSPPRQEVRRRRPGGGKLGSGSG
jgi:hypothetical protein